MTPRHETPVRSWLDHRSFLEGWALRGALRAGYKARNLRSDIAAGITVGIIALPLSMALAIASGAPPQSGLATAAIAGAIGALVGGSRYNVTGPTAAFVVLLAPVAAKFGLAGLALASLMASAILVIMGVARLGRLIQFIPHPVTTGFTSGIAVVIATLQVRDFFGLQLSGALPTHFLEKISVIIDTFPTMRVAELSIGLFSLAVLILTPKISRRVPPALAVAVLGSLAAWVMTRYLGGDWQVATIGSRFTWEIGNAAGTGIPPMAPQFVLPWTLPGPGGEPLVLNHALLRELVMPATAIAMLGAIESLLCAVVADGMKGTKHDPNVELVGQGLANLGAVFFGGFAATGAIARTAASIRAGAVSPFASLVHALFVVVAMVAMAPLLSYLPMATLAALLLMVAWTMSDLKHFGHIIRVAPRSDVVVLLTCFSLTVIFDMVIAVSVGVILAALLFIRRMVEISSARLIDTSNGDPKAPIPEGVVVYEIAGPLFFGAAEKAIGSLMNTFDTHPPRAVLLNLTHVPVMDMTGLVAFETLLERLRRSNVFVVLVGVQERPALILERDNITSIEGVLEYAPDLPAAVRIVEATLNGKGTATPKAE